MLKPFNFSSLLLVILVVVQFGCTERMEPEADEAAQADTTNYSQLVAVIHPTEGNEVTGTVTFEESNDGVRVEAELEGLEEGKHGFHIHQYGDCTANDGTSAGGHFNPTDSQHGAPTDEERHVGDMGNITANEQGQATLEYFDNTIRLNGPNSILGRAVVIHGGADDLSSQPSGDAGPRVACGVIGIANPM